MNMVVDSQHPVAGYKPHSASFLISRGQHARRRLTRENDKLPKDHRNTPFGVLKGICFGAAGETPARYICGSTL